MRRYALILLIAHFVLLGTGAIRYLHALEHSHQRDHCHHSDGGAPHPQTPREDGDSSCDLCLQLHAPMMWVESAIALVCLSFIEFTGPQAPTIRCALAIDSIDCRGPPAPPIGI
jgi:hypothetical protein